MPPVEIGDNARMPTGSTNGASANGDAPVEHLDVVVVGAGLSGIGTACHLTSECPDRSYAVLEARDAIGGTWDLFRYPGIRSDSDMFTLGYGFRPWSEAKAIADGPAIRSYVVDTAREYGVDRKIRLNHRLLRAEWSTPDSRWCLEIERTDTGESTRMTCDFLQMSSGYYDYAEGYTPELPGIERFDGRVVHPQHWPEDLDYSGQRVVVIGSGATAVTLVPSMAPQAEHVTLLQRSPTFVIAMPGTDPLAVWLRRFLPGSIVFPFMRWKNALLMVLSFQLSRRFPEQARKLLRRWSVALLPEGYDVDTHFNPTYDPWDQRLCLVPDGDLFAAIGEESASIVTDRIKTITEAGIELESGAELEADLIITATGLNVQVFGGAEFVVDGRAIDLTETVSYKGMMLSGVPNMVMTMGYTNASWTLKADLVSEYFCRMLNHMKAAGLRRFTPQPPPPSVAREPFIDLKSGYVLRSLAVMPKQGARRPWKLRQNYPIDVMQLRHGPLEDEGIEFSPKAGTGSGAGGDALAPAGTAVG